MKVWKYEIQSLLSNIKKSWKGNNLKPVRTIWLVIQRKGKRNGFKDSKGQTELKANPDGHWTPLGGRDCRGIEESQGRARATCPNCNCWSLAAAEKSQNHPECDLFLLQRKMSRVWNQGGPKTYMPRTRTMPGVLPHHLSSEALLSKNIFNFVLSEPLVDHLPRRFYAGEGLE